MVSVIIPVYNGELYIGQAIESVLAQTYKDIEIIVVDDGSTDSTASIAGKYAGIKYIRQDNAGPSAARNRGMAASKGEYVAFLDSDDIYAENKLEVQVRALEQDRDADIVYNDCIAVDKDLKYVNTIKSEGVYEDRRDFLCMLLFRQIIPILPSIMLRRKCYEDGFIYDEKYKHAEDYDFTIRLAQRYKFLYVPEPLYFYRRHGNNLTNAHKLQQSSEIRILRELGFERIEEIVCASGFPPQEKSFLLAKIYIKLSEHRLAKDIMLKLAGENFDDPYLWFYLGNCSYMLGEKSDAVQYYQNAISKDCSMAEAYNNLACIYAEDDKPMAAELLVRALELRPNYMDAEHNLKQLADKQPSCRITVRELRKVLTNYINTVDK